MRVSAHAQFCHPEWLRTPGASAINLESIGVSCFTRIGNGLRQFAAPSSARATTNEHCLRNSASGLFGHLMLVCLWKFVGRARDPCRSTVRVSTWTRVIYCFCNVYKRAPVMGVPP